MRKAVLAAVAAFALVGLFASTASAGAPDPGPGTIVDIAVGNPDFSTLVAAVTAADLVDTLSGEGPFTVFAPTNAAFDALPEGTLDSLLEDPGGALTDILLLHVISGAVNSEAAIAAAGGTVETLGGPVTVELEGDNLVVGGATVVTADIEASNGIIHVIDAVITAPAETAPPEQTTTTTTTAPPAAGPATAAPLPTRVDTGNSGLATETTSASVLLAALAGLALMGIGTSTYALARNRRER
jgi:uncharacterized surface protein with fasciclin (FAS1) repeats